MAAAKNRSAEKDLTQRARRSEHRGHRELLRWGIGDFTKDGGTVGACGGGHVARTVVKSLVCQQSEGESFFRVLGDAESRRRQNVDGLGRACLRRQAKARPHNFGGAANAESGGELGDKKRILGAAAGDDELMDFGLRKHEAVQRVDHGERGENGGGAD